MKAILIIAHHCILPGAYKGFEEILDRLHHDMPGTRVASTSLLDLENDLRTLLREDVESVMLLPYLLLNGQHTKNDVPKVVARLQAEFPEIPITLLPCLGDWKEFASMVVDGVRNAQVGMCRSERSEESPMSVYIGSSVTAGILRRLRNPSAKKPGFPGFRDFALHCYATAPPPFQSPCPKDKGLVF